MTTTEQRLKSHQHELDQKFHEYKLAALTGMMYARNEENFSEKDANNIAAACDKVALAMERLDRAEGGS